MGVGKEVGFCCSYAVPVTNLKSRQPQMVDWQSLESFHGMPAYSASLCAKSQRGDGMGIFVIAKGLVAVSVSFRKKLRLLILFTFSSMDAECGKTSTGFLNPAKWDDREKNVWESFGKRWSYAASQNLDEHLWRLRSCPSWTDTQQLSSFYLLLIPRAARCIIKLHPASPLL